MISTTYRLRVIDEQGMGMHGDWAPTEDLALVAIGNLERLDRRLLIERRDGDGPIRTVESESHCGQWLIGSDTP